LVGKGGILPLEFPKVSEELLFRGTGDGDNEDVLFAVGAVTSITLPVGGEGGKEGETV